MDFSEARGEFINTWGNYGQQWGINKAMGQIHALLLISTKPLCSIEIMEMLQISSGNANMNIRALLSLGLITKIHMPGERKEYFQAEKDITVIARILTSERRRRGMEPMIKSLSKIRNTEGKASQIRAFRKIVKDISNFASKAEKSMEKLIENL